MKQSTKQLLKDFWALPFWSKLIAILVALFIPWTTAGGAYVQKKDALASKEQK